MKLGFMTNVLVKYGMKDFHDVASWAEENGFDCLEVGPTIPLDEELYRDVLAKHNVAVSALTYCRNFLSSDPEEAKGHVEELKKRIRFASKLGIEKVVTSTGIDKRVEEGIYDTADSIRRTPRRSLDLFEETFTPIVELAKDCHVKIAFENCPIMGNIAISPVMWREIFKRFDTEWVGLTYDPSHLVWQMIDPYEHIAEFAPKIVHVHAKDMHVDFKALHETGFLTDFDWWHARIPGQGDVDWNRLFTELKKNGFDNSVSIEHEDHNYEGTLEKVEEGILWSKNYLTPIIKGE